MNMDELKSVQSLANHLRVVADEFHLISTHKRYWTTERCNSQKFSPNRQRLLVVKAENIYSNTTKMHNAMETELSQ